MRQTPVQGLQQPPATAAVTSMGNMPPVIAVEIACTRMR